jgi:hypothetical protein
MSEHTLANLRNTYPGDEVTVSDSYQTDAGAIKYTGKYPQNFIEFQTLALDDIIVAGIAVDTDITFNFIVRFMFTNGTTEDWTSDAFLKELQQAQQDNNPFFSRDRVTVAEINYELLEQHCNSEKFLNGEDYAEVKITKTIGIHRDIPSTETIVVKKEILKHIQWIVGSDDELRRPIQDDFGNWELYTSQFVSGSLVGTLGFESDIEDTVVPVIPPPPPPTTTTVGQAPSAPVSTYPFSTRGNYIGEIRKKRGKGFFGFIKRDTYKWTETGWIKI